MTDNDETKPAELTGSEALRWVEQMCWMILVMTPIVWWLQGPSVSPDQFVVRTALVILSAVGAIGLRVRAVYHDRRAL